MYAEFSIPGGDNPAGYCTPVSNPDTCVAIPADGSQDAETVENFWHCEKTDDSGYCSAAPST